MASYIVVYNDTKWILNLEETKSTSGYVFTFDGGVVTRNSAKQTTIVKSSMENFITLELDGNEIEWLKKTSWQIFQWAQNQHLLYPLL